MTRCDRSITSPPYTVVTSVAQLQQLIKGAKPGQQIRVRGSMHSVCDAIRTDADASNGLDLYLAGDLATVGPHPTLPGVIRAGAGIRLGADPDEGVDEKDSLLYWLATRNPGMSVPDLGGIIHQSLGGFLSTGSSGGSLKYSFEQAIVGFSFVDGTGTLREVAQGDDDFAAIGVSMGLLGVLTSVDLKPVQRFAIKGQESTSEITDAGYSLFEDGPKGLEAFLRANDYCRIMWWPQKDVNKLVTWTAQREYPIPTDFEVIPYRELGDSDENPKTYPAELWTLAGNLFAALTENFGDLKKFFAAHEAELPKVMSEFVNKVLAEIESGDIPGLIQILEDATNEEIQEVGVDLYFTLLGNRVTNPLAKAIFTTTFGSEAEWEDTWSPLINDKVFLIDDADKIVPGPQQFQDYAESGLPMDNQISDLLMPTEFTELWIPIGKTVEVMKLLAEQYEKYGYAATGTYACELYAAMSSDFLMSPAAGTEVIRVDIFWFGRNGDMTAPDFYDQFWTLLAKNGIGFRPHWGKYLPPVAAFGPAWYQKVYGQNLTTFLNARTSYDPNQLFVTDYWRAQLGIPKLSV